VSDLADRPPNHLSFGQKRRVAIAGVLAMEPAILILDEPTSNLDPASRRELANTLHALDTTLLVVTHDLPFALEMCPRTVVMDKGTIVASAPTTEILRNDELLRQHRLELPYGFAIAVGD
jgi:cobalt/nickel transport system ATP-binding protein